MQKPSRKQIGKSTKIFLIVLWTVLTVSEFGIGKSIVILLDASQSMNQRPNILEIQGSKQEKIRWIDWTKQWVFNKLRQNWFKNSYALMVFGSKQKKVCEDYELVLNFAKSDLSVLKKAKTILASIQPVGMSPVGESLKKAIQIVSKEPAPREIHLVSDLVDPCGKSDWKEIPALLRVNQIHLKILLIRSPYSNPIQENILENILKENTHVSFFPASSMFSFVSASISSSVRKSLTTQKSSEKHSQKKQSYAKNLPSKERSPKAKNLSLATQKESKKELFQKAQALNDNPKPSYPYSGRRYALEGKVILGLHINIQGKVKKIEILESSGHKSLDDRAKKVLKEWKFKPATWNGKAVEDFQKKSILFRMQP